MRIRIRSDPLILCPPDLVQVLFSTDPDPDPTCNNGFMKLFLSRTKYKSESTNSSIKFKYKMMGYNIEFYPYLSKI